MQLTLNKTHISILVLCILYAVGLCGTVFFELNLMSLTSVNIIISVAILFLNHPKVDVRFALYSLIVACTGWLIEWAGVETGLIFGQYFYGNNLGFKIADIPLIIGINWLLLSYCSAVVAGKLFSLSSVFNSIYPKVILGALLMVLVDFFIEQVAPTYDFWYWKNQNIPLQNYVSWFAFSFVFNYLFHRLHINSSNKIAPWLYGLVLLFFMGLAIHNTI